MTDTLRRLDILASASSGGAAEKIYDFLQGVREDAASAIAGETIYHKALLTNSTEKNANGTTVETSITLANSLRTLISAHLASEGVQGVHRVASAEAIAAAVATDEASAYTLVNELKADYNTHLTESGVHLQDDSTNDVTSADATTSGSLYTLVTEIKADYNAHILSTMASMRVE